MFAVLDNEKLKAYKALNPIRDHIKLVFQEVEKDGELPYILQNIEDKIQPDVSRAIVFCNSRRLTEESALDTNKHFNGIPALKNKAGHYHAGMSAEERAETYEDYQEGKLLILFATKAFGMGMDIPNIHHVYHYAPSSSFEDYLQEVGRGGRKSSALRVAGFSTENPITAVCLYTKDSFAKIRDRMQKSQASWSDFANAFEEFKHYLNRVANNKKSLKDVRLPVPLNLLDVSEKYAAKDINTNLIFRLSLYWLEKAKRIRASTYAQAYLEFENAPYLNHNLSGSIKDPKIKELYAHVYHTKQTSFNYQASTLVNGYVLAQAIGLDNGESVYDWVLKAEKQDKLKLVNNIKVPLTELAYHEQALNRQGGNRMLQYLYCIQKIALQIIDALQEDEEVILDSEYLRRVAEEATQEVMVDDFIHKRLKLSYAEKMHVQQYLETPNLKAVPEESKAAVQYVNGLKPNQKELFDIIHEQRKQLKSKKYFKKMRAVFYLLSTFCKVKAKTKFDKDKIGNLVQLLTLMESKKEAKDKVLEVVQAANKLFKAVSKLTPKMSVNALIIEAGLQNQQYGYTETLLVLLKKLGYIKFSGGLMPMAINIEFDNLSALGNLKNDKALKEEYQETVNAKKLRLLVLEAFSTLHGKTTQDEFILDYFQKKTSEEVANLIEQHVSKAKADKLLGGFRSEALEKRVAQLNSGQKAVYDAKINEHLSVLAGPGTGKTHTLVLRVARLIQKENISPQKILILAYNRAVVEELKARLKELFVNMGYKLLTNDLQIHTFHSLVGKVLAMNRQNTDDNLHEWEDNFLELYRAQGSRVLQGLGEIEYVFVDEFQDITNKRLAILEAMAPPKHAFLTVIGDPNQSIYGYERVKEGSSRAPQPYYDKFNERYTPATLQLNINYRSTQEIIDISYKALPQNAPQIAIKAHQAHNGGSSYQRLPKDSWHNALAGLLATPVCKEVAIMFRSNEELYRAYPDVKKLVDNTQFELKIKGTTVNFTKQREIAYVLEKVVASSAQKPIQPNDRGRLRQYIDQLIPHFPNWDKQPLYDLSTLFEYYFDNYREDVTYQDFVDFVNELTQKDDGQLMGLLKKTNQANPKPQVILTTIHRVKGLEFQYVIVPPATAKLPFEDNPNEDDYDPQELQEIMDEEKRLLYVAFSRAKEQLLVEPSSREKNIYAGIPFAPPTEQLGMPIKSGTNNTTLSWKAWKSSPTGVHEFIHEQLQLRASLNIEMGAYNKYYLKAGYRAIERFQDWVKFTELRYTGVFVENIVRYTAEECQKYDKKNDTNFYDSWGQVAKARGYIYLVNFYGYAQSTGK